MNLLGNLDSQNSLEIMNIIKAISKEKLVILVTHENDLAKFYANRIIEIKDGKIEKDYINEHSNELDYQIENKFYLKDFQNTQSLKDDNININVFSDKKENIGLNIVVKHGNIYIESTIPKKIEIVDENSNIEFIDDNYRKIKKEEVEKYKFDFDDIINKNIKKKYTSIYNPITMFTNGFKNIMNFSVLKKILLLGFLVSAMFIAYSVSTIKATLNIKDEDFIKYNSNYLIVELPKVNVEDYSNYESKENIDYILPGNSIVSFNIKFDDFYQSSVLTDTITGSIASTSLVSEDNLIYGRMPQNEYELLIDKMTLDNVFKSDEAQILKMIGITKYEQFLERELTLNMNNINNFKIVGIVDLGSPSIYSDDSMFINIISLSNNVDEYGMYDMEVATTDYNQGENEQDAKIYDYNLFTDKIELKKGRAPENDYEVIVNISNKDSMPLNKELKILVNDKKLKVVGYYDSKYDINYYLANRNTVKYKTITEKSGFVISAQNSEDVLAEFKNLNLNIKNSYESAKEKYLAEQKETIKNNLTVSGIILIISLIEIFLIVRSSFLSRIKEIGILRAIGIKKKDIYKIFAGEIVAITTLTSVPGILLMSYILGKLSKITYLERLFIIDLNTILLSLIFIYAFNLLIGLLPVHRVVRKTPAQILSRHDI